MTATEIAKAKSDIEATTDYGTSGRRLRAAFGGKRAPAVMVGEKRFEDGEAR